MNIELTVFKIARKLTKKCSCIIEFSMVEFTHKQQVWEFRTPAQSFFVVFYESGYVEWYYE